ncbi:hypothetical protein YPPY01_2703, partial [Yersinia pestis PY-01]
MLPQAILWLQRVLSF